MAGILEEGPIRRLLREKGLMKREQSSSPQRSRFEVTFEGVDADKIIEGDLLFTSIPEIARRRFCTYHVKKIE